MAHGDFYRTLYVLAVGVVLALKTISHLHCHSQFTICDMCDRVFTMGDVKGHWPDLQADDTLARGQATLRDGQRIVDTNLTRGELAEEVTQLIGLVRVLSAELDAERSRPDPQALLDDHRQEIDDQMSGLFDDVKSCLSTLTRLETDVIDRLGQVEGESDSDPLQEVEYRMLGEVAKLQSGQGDLTEQIIDLRSSQLKVNERHGAENEQVERLQGQLDQVTLQLHQTLQSKEALGQQLAELRESHEHLMAHVVDLRSLQSELGSRQMATIVENGRLRDELLLEASQIRAVVEESHEVANKAMSRASSTSDNNDALQAEFEQNAGVAEHRLGLLESLIVQVDQRLLASHAQVSELAAQAIAQAKASEIASEANTQTNAAPDEQVLLAHIDAQVVAGVQQSAERLNQAWLHTDQKLSHVEAVSFEQSRRGAEATEALVHRIRQLEARLAEFEQRV